MKVLVTGANGLLAANLVRELLEAGYEVRGMVRKNSNLLSLKKVETELFRGEITDPESVHRAIEGCNVVIHAAANTSQWPTYAEAFKKTNVEATRILLETSVRRDVEKFIFVGSANAFDAGSKTSPGTEESPFSIRGKSGYMISKQAAQQLVLEEHRQSGFHALVVNPTFMIGKYDSRPSSGQIVLMAHGKSLMLYPPGGKNFVHVNDVAKGIVNALEKGRAGQCYLLANENLSYGEFFEKVRELSNTPKLLMRLPEFVVKSAGLSGSLFEKVLHQPARLDLVNARLLCSGNYYSSAKAVTELEMPQTPIVKAIEDAIEWFGQYGYLR